MLRVAALLAASILLAGPAAAADTDASVVITNQSQWQIHQLFISSVDEQEWGPDQLGEAVIGTGEKFTLNDIPCDAYDIRVVDEDGDACVIDAVALCVDADAWVIKDSDLLACQAASE